MLNLRETDTSKNHDQYARGMTKHTTAVQGGFLSGVISVITAMTTSIIGSVFLFQA